MVVVVTIVIVVVVIVVSTVFDVVLTISLTYFGEILKSEKSTTEAYISKLMILGTQDFTKPKLNINGFSKTCTRRAIYYITRETVCNLARKLVGI